MSAPAVAPRGADLAAETPARPVRREPLVVAAALLALVALLLHLGAGITWFYDEWTWIVRASPVGRPGLDGLLEPGNGHLSLALFGTYRLLLHTVGLDHYLPLRAIVAVLHALTVLGLYLYARRRLPLPLAASVAVLAALLGSGWQMLFWGAGMTFVLPVGAAVWALLLLDDDRPAAAVGAALVVALALSMSALGVCVALAALLDSLRPRPDRVRRVALMAAPLVLFAAWYLTLRGPGPGVVGAEAGRGQQAAFAVDVASAAVAGLFRGTPGQGLLGLLLLGGLVAVALVRGPQRGRLLVVLSLPSSFWVLTALSRAGLGETDASRYLYAGGLWVLLVLVEAAPRVARLTSRSLHVAVAVVLAVVLVPQVDLLRRGASSLHSDSAETVASLAAAELYRDRVPADFQPGPRVMPGLGLAAYESAVGAFGDPAVDPLALPGQPPVGRAAADATLLRAAAVAPLPAQGARPPHRRAAADAAEVRLPAGTVLLDSPAPVRVEVRRLADGFRPEVAVEVPAGASRLELPRDALSDVAPWHLRLVTAQQLTVCT